jgi:hypothetical protein
MVHDLVQPSSTLQGSAATIPLLDFDLPFLLFHPHHPYYSPPGDFDCNTTDSLPEDYDCIINDANANESHSDESTGNDAKGWNIKCYKFLGTLTSSMAKEYFLNLNIHEIHFTEISTNYISSFDDDMSKEGSDNMISMGSGLIELAFSKSKVEDRKGWLNRVEKDTFLNYREAQKNSIKHLDFIIQKLVLFSKYKNIR